MAKRVTFLGLGLLLATGCSSRNTVPAHAYDVAIEYNGAVTHSFVAFPERDPEAMHAEANDPCSFANGDCGHDDPTEATINAEGPILYASFTTGEAGDFGEYELIIRQTPEDDAADAKYRAESASYVPTGTGCWVGDKEVGQRIPCVSRSHVFITLTPR